MQCTRFLGAWLAILAFTNVTSAQLKYRLEENADQQLEYVRNLRNKNWHDLALEYMTVLESQKDPKLQALLPLERARTLVAIARDKEAEKRFTLFQEARGELQKYVKQNQGKPEGAFGQLELARLTTFHAQAMLTRAMREEEPAEQHTLARPAEAMFIEAAKETDVAIQALQAAAKTKEGEAFSSLLAKELQQAKFDRGIHLIDQARTYINIADDKVLRKRAELTAQAKKIFVEMAPKEDPKTGKVIDPNNVDEVSFLAYAWLMKTSMEMQSPDETTKYYRRVINYDDPIAYQGLRWAKLFYMQDVLKNPANQKLPIAKKLGLIETEGRGWLTQFAPYVRGPEGQGVLWELGNCLFSQGQLAMGPKPKTGPHVINKQAENYFTEAIKTLDRLAQIDGDYTERASQMSLAIQFMLMETSKRDFQTFDDWFLKARYEMYQLRKLAQQEEGKTKLTEKQMEDKRKQHLKSILQAFSKALTIADSRTSIQKLDDARFYMAAGYRLSGDLYRAAIAGEALGRMKPPTRRAPSAAAYAIDAYAALYGANNDDGTRGRLQELAEFVLTPENQRLWSTEAVTNIANYQLGMLANRDKNYMKAVTHLEKLTPEFTGYTYAQGQLVFISLAGRKDAKVEDAKRLSDSARRALSRMSLPTDVDTTTAAMYFNAKLEGPKFLFADAANLLNRTDAEAADGKHQEMVKSLAAADAKYKEMSKSVAELSDQFSKLNVKLSGENTDRIGFTIQVLKKYADMGQATLLYRTGKNAEALKLVEPIIKAVQSKDNGKDTIKFKDVDIVGDMVGLGLRVHVQEGKVDEAKKLLAILKRLESEEDNNPFAESNRNRVIVNVLKEMGFQLTRLKTSKEKEDQETLKKLEGNFSGFLDNIANDYEKKGFKVNDKIDTDSIRLLANAFSSMGKHARAADIIDKAPRPSPLNQAKGSKFEPKDEEDLQSYWSMRLQFARSLRAAGDKVSLEKGMKSLNELLNHDHGRFHIYAEFERNLLVEEQGFLAAAVQQWNKFLSNKEITRVMSQNPKLKELYFEGYFNATRVLLKYAKTDPKAAPIKQKFVEACAKQVVSLEFAANYEGWKLVGALYEDLLSREPELKAVYDRMKADRTKK